MHKLRLNFLIFRNFRFPVGGSSLISQRNCPIAEEALRPLSTTLPVSNASSQLHSMASSPKVRIVSNHERSQQATNSWLTSMVPSPKPRIVSTHGEPGHTNLGFVANGAIPSNNQQALDLLKSLDKRRKPALLSKARWAHSLSHFCHPNFSHQVSRSICGVGPHSLTLQNEQGKTT